MQNGENVLRRRSNGLWLLVALLGILVMVSLILISSLLLDLTAGENHLISLEPGETNGPFTSIFFKPANPDPEVTVSDDKVIWEQDTQVDLFQAAYTDPEGKNVTVQSKNKLEHVVAPGTSNDYTFTIANDGNVSLHYTMTFGSTFARSGVSIPVIVRLSDSDGRWIAGSDTEWIDADALNDVAEEADLEAGGRAAYTLQWQWPFENEDEESVGKSTPTDLNDTDLGNISAAGQDTDFTLSINIVSELTPGAVTINRWLAGLPIVLLPLGLLGLWFIYLWKRRIVVTGLLTGQDGNAMHFRRRSNTVTDGRFSSRHFFFGKKNYMLQTSDGTRLAEMAYKLKHKRKLDGIAFEASDDGVLTILVGKGIIGIELYLDQVGDTITIDTSRWSAIDRRHHNVYSQTGTKEADGNKCNETAAGLKVDKDGKLTV